MKSSCIVFVSKAGIVAASDSDYSIRQISKTSPVALAINASSPFPWKTLIDDFLLENENGSYPSLYQFYEDFRAYLGGRKIPTVVFKKKPEEPILIMGFNQDDIYPSLIKAKIEVDNKSTLVLSAPHTKNIDHQHPAFFHCIGDFNFVGPILDGVSKDFMKTVKQNEMKMLDSYRTSIFEIFKGHPIGNDITKDFSDTHLNKIVDKKFKYSNECLHDIITVGIASFSIQDMVDYAETLIDAELRLRNLKERKPGNSMSTREIAVITIPEGFTWIKHHLFAL